MKITYKCHICKNYIKLPYIAKDRGVLAQKRNLSVNCSFCNNKITPEINKIKAVISNYNRYSFVIALVINILLGVYMYLFSSFEMNNSNSNWQYYTIAIIFFIPFIIAKVSFENDLKSVKLFNSYYV